MRILKIILLGMFVFSANYVYADFGLDSLAFWKARLQKNRHARSARRYYNSADYGETVKEFEKALALKPTKREKKAWLPMLGKAYEELKMYDRAISTYEEVIKIDKKNYKRYIDLGRVYSTVELHDKSTAIFEKALELNDRSSEALLFLGKEYKSKGLLNRAEGLFLKLLKDNPSNIEVSEELSYTYEQKGRIDDAIKYLEKVIEKEPTSARYARLGFLYIILKDYGKALNAYGRVRELDPSAEGLDFDMIFAYWMGDRIEESEALIGGITGKPGNNTESTGGNDEDIRKASLAYCINALMMYQNKRYDTALKSARLAVKISKSDFVNNVAGKIIKELEASR